MKDTLLFKKIYGSLAGAAVGDAMGGPVEGWTREAIRETHGRVEGLLTYTIKPSCHGPFTLHAGSYTDDTRLMKLLARACIERGGPPLAGDIALVLSRVFFRSDSALERDFLEEYVMKALYRDEKEVFGGQPTNGGIMAVSPLGLISPCDPRGAYANTFRELYFCTGYARSATALAAAMISAAMNPGAGVDGIIEAALAASEVYRKTMDGAGWRSWHMYREVAGKSETLVEKAWDLGRRYRDAEAMAEDLHTAVVQTFFADGAESLAIAVAMFVAAGGDCRRTITGAVNFGRDNDSSAAVGGAIAGAFGGIDSLDTGWVETVERANPEPSLQKLAEDLTEVISMEITRQQEKSGNLAGLL